ncbi:MAG: RHS repeat-associated core domain-containing protein, partial [Armatimonadetes bacterium]|nr:RHS repeat-associated core domain-containing protein [Armatimonadota bacterium]
RLASRAWARGITTWYTNNNAGQLWVVNYSDSTPDVTFGYDRRGRQTTVAANGSTMTRALTDAGLVLSESFSGGTLNGLAVTNGFDSLLRRSAVALNTQPSTLTQYGYDGASRLQNVTNGSSRATYSYLANSPLVENAVFRQSGTTRMTTTKTYDYVNRLTAISSAPSGASVVSSAYAYNSASQRTGLTNADSSFWVYTYDSMGQVTSGRKYFSDGTPVAGQQFDYGFDDIGNRQTTARDSRSAFYTNNLLNQITDRMVPGYVNVLGTATSTATVTVNNTPTARRGDYYRTELAVMNGSAPVWLGVTNVAVLNQGANPDIVASVTGNVFVVKSPEICGYDADGNMTNDGRWLFTWDAENRLKQVESKSDAPSLSRRKVTWEFDGQGRRIRQTTYDGSSGSYVVKEDLKFLSDGWAHIAELNATNNALVRSYVWGLDLSGSQGGAGGAGGLLIVNSTANGAHFCAYDGNGNVAALVKATDGSETARYEYGPFGEPIRATGLMAKENPFRFSTKRTDNTTDFVLYEYRLYSPSMGRWPNRDPMEENGGENLYAFVDNNPNDLIDPYGLSARAWLTGQIKTAIERTKHSGNYRAEDKRVFKAFGIAEVGVKYGVLGTLTSGSLDLYSPKCVSVSLSQPSRSGMKR